MGPNTGQDTSNYYPLLKKYTSTLLNSNEPFLKIRFLYDFWKLYLNGTLLETDKGNK